MGIITSNVIFFCIKKIGFLAWCLRSSKLSESYIIAAVIIIIIIISRIILEVKSEYQFGPGAMIVV